jgi:hypothetical protein
MFNFLALTTFFYLVLTARTSVLNESVCPLLPTPTASAAVTGEEYARFSGMQTVIGISERYSTLRFSSREMMSLTNVELGPRGLFTRQV